MRSYSVFFANYTIGEDAYVQVPQVCRPFGTKIFLIGGRKGMDAAGGLLEEVLKGTDLVVLESVEFGSDCTYKDIDRWADVFYKYCREVAHQAVLQVVGDERFHLCGNDSPVCGVQGRWKF